MSQAQIEVVHVVGGNHDFCQPVLQTVDPHRSRLPAEDACVLSKKISRYLVVEI